MLVTRHNIAMWRGQAGDPVAAIAGLVEVLADRERLLGPEHPETMSTRADIGRWRVESGEAAVDELTDVLEDQTRLLGPTHPDPLATRLSLATAHGRGGDGPRAADDLDALVADLLDAVGPDHPLTRHAQAERARWST